jgi:hypothetical protein
MMNMMTQIIDLHPIDQKARQIKAGVSTVLTKWGLLPRFKHWLLTQDPGTGMIVLFGVLNNQYIAEHTSIPFSDYFDPRLLHDLENELQVQVVSGDSDGLRYAFILDRGRFEGIPVHTDHSLLDDDKLLVRVVYGAIPQSVPVPPVDTAMLDEEMLVRQNVRALVKFLDNTAYENDAAIQFIAQHLPDIVVIDEEEFNKQAAEYEANRQRSIRIKALLDGSMEASG